MACRARATGRSAGWWGGSRCRPSWSRRPGTAAATASWDIQDGVLVGLTPGQMPEREPAPEPEPTAEERLRADVDYLAIMTGVEL